MYHTCAACSPLQKEAADALQVAQAAEELWTELCGQTWRPELDYGLSGVEATPKDHLLLVMSG